MKLNHSGNVFTITNIVRSDTGFYVCQATNHAGNINATFFINVQCKYTLEFFSKFFFNFFLQVLFLYRLCDNQINIAMTKTLKIIFLQWLF